jgi:hypothetical protein
LGLFLELDHQNQASAASGFARRPRPKKIKVGSCESGELFLAFAFLFAASSSCESGEKRTTAEIKGPEVPFGQKTLQIPENT